MREIGCIILAAGRAERFGRNKLLEPLAGKPLLSYVLEMLPRERFAKIVAVVSARETELLCRARGIDVLLYGGGPQSDSIRLGLSAMEDMDGCLFLMGDQPLCGRESVCRMADGFLADPGHIYRLAFAGTQASPVLFPRELFPALSDLRGERGGMAAARGWPGGIATVEAAEAAELWDADTPQALERLERYLARKREEI